MTVACEVGIIGNVVFCLFAGFIQVGFRECYEKGVVGGTIMLNDWDFGYATGC